MTSNYIILSGPAMAVAVQNSLTPLATKYLSLMNVSATGLPLVGTIVSPPSILSKQLVIGTLKNDGDLGALLSMMTTVLKQFKGHQIIVSDADALVLAIALSNIVNTTDPVLVAAWTALNFTVEAQAEAGATTNSVRFVGTNIVGIKALATASAVTLTITAK